jgi:hypothetical protein
MTRNEYRYMLDLKSLDDIRLGMRAPSMAVKHPVQTQERCIARGWVRFEPDDAGGFVTLRTAGYRALQREFRRIVMSLAARRADEIGRQPGPITRIARS